MNEVISAVGFIRQFAHVEGCQTVFYENSIRRVKNIAQLFIFCLFKIPSRSNVLAAFYVSPCIDSMHGETEMMTAAKGCSSRCCSSISRPVQTNFLRTL